MELKKRENLQAAKEKKMKNVWLCFKTAIKEQTFTASLVQKAYPRVDENTEQHWDYV